MDHWLQEESWTGRLEPEHTLSLARYAKDLEFCYTLNGKALKGLSEVGRWTGNILKGSL